MSRSTTTRRINHLVWLHEIAVRDSREDRLMRRCAERRAALAERQQARLERRVRWLVRVIRAERAGRPVPIRRKRQRCRTWLTDACETLTLPAHRWEALQPGGMIR